MARKSEKLSAKEAWSTCLLSWGFNCSTVEMHTQHGQSQPFGKALQYYNAGSSVFKRKR